MARVVCLHGLGRTPGDWDGVRASLEAFGEVITPSLPRRTPEALSVTDAAIGDGDTVVGHSMGGVLALRLARERPRPLRALVLTGCFYPPARNGRTLSATISDYAAHRVAFVRSGNLPKEKGSGRFASAPALASLVRLATRPGGFSAAQAAVTAPVLVVHARDDDFVPIDFALAAAAGRPGWEVAVLEHGGHHAHVARPAAWLEAVIPFLLTSRRTPTLP